MSIRYARAADLPARINNTSYPAYKARDLLHTEWLSEHRLRVYQTIPLPKVHVQYPHYKKSYLHSTSHNTGWDFPNTNKPVRHHQ